MCDASSFGGNFDIGNWTGSKKNQHKANVESDAAAAALEQETALARQIWEQQQRYYGPTSDLGAGLLEQAQYSPERAATARGMAVQDVDRQFQLAQEELRQRQAALGVNPGSPAGQALERRADVAKAAAKSAAATHADLAERNRATGIGMQLEGQSVPMQQTALGGYGNAAGVNASMANANTMAAAQRDTAGPWWAPSPNINWNLRSGGRINAPTGGAVEDPPQFDGAADIPMMKGADGVFRAPGRGMAHGHITGPGNETSDSIPAELSKNEYVVPAFATLFYGTDKLDKMIEKARVGMGMAPAQGGTPQRVAGDAPQQAGRGMAPPAPAASAAPAAPAASGGTALDERRKVDDLFAPVHAPTGGIQAGEPGGGYGSAGMAPQPLQPGVLPGFLDNPTWRNAFAQPQSPASLPAATPTSEVPSPETPPAAPSTPFTYSNDRVRYANQPLATGMARNTAALPGVYYPFSGNPSVPIQFHRGGRRARRGGLGMRPIRVAEGGAWGEAGKALRQPASSTTGARP